MVGVTAEAELKSLVGLAAVVKRGEGQLIIVDKTVHLYAPEYIGTKFIFYVEIEVSASLLIKELLVIDNEFLS